MRRALAAAALVAAMARSVVAVGHPMPNTMVLVSARPSGFDAELSIPLSELGAAIGEALEEGRADLAALRSYLLTHAAVVGADGRAWPARITRLDFDNVQRPTLEVSLSFLKPEGAGRSGATLRYDAVTHRVASHNVLIYFRENPRADVKPFGRLQAPAATLPLPSP